MSVVIFLARVLFMSKKLLQILRKKIKKELIGCDNPTLVSFYLN